MSKNFGLKGGELDSNARPGMVLAKQRAASLPKAEAEAYLWLDEHGKATKAEIWAAGFNPDIMKSLRNKGLVIVDFLYKPNVHSVFRVTVHSVFRVAP